MVMSDEVDEDASAMMTRSSSFVPVDKHSLAMYTTVVDEVQYRNVVEGRCHRGSSSGDGGVATVRHTRSISGSCPPRSGMGLFG